MSRGARSWVAAELTVMLIASVSGSLAAPAAALDGARILRPQADAVVARAGGSKTCAVMPGDGSYENALGFNESQQAANLAQRFEVPPSPGDSVWFLDDVCVALTRNSATGDATFTIAAFLDQGGLPGEVLAFRQVTTPIPEFPDSTICLEDFAVPLVGRDAIHVGVAWSPQEYDLYVNMNESPGTPAQIVSARSSAAGPKGLAGWSSVTSFDPDIRSAGIGITLFESQPEWSTTTLPAPGSVPLDDAVPILGGVGIDRGHEFHALAVYPGPSPTSPQTFVWISGASDAAGQSTLTVLDTPFVRAISLGAIQPDPTRPGAYWLAVVSSELEVWIGDVAVLGAAARAPGRALFGDAVEVAFERPDFDHQGDYGSVVTLNLDGDGSNPPDPKRAVLAYDSADSRLELWGELDPGEWNVETTLGEDVVIAGALRPMATELPIGPNAESSHCIFWSEQSVVSQDRFDFMVECPGSGRGRQDLRQRDRRASRATGQQVLLEARLTSHASDVHALPSWSGSLPEDLLDRDLPASSSLDDVLLVFPDEDVVTAACLDVGPGRIVLTGLQPLVQGSPQRSSVIVAGSVAPFTSQVLYLNQDGEYKGLELAGTGDGCAFEVASEQSLPGLEGADGFLIRLLRIVDKRRARDGMRRSLEQLTTPVLAEEILSVHGAAALDGRRGDPDPRAGGPVSRLTLAERRVPRPCLPGPEAHCLSDGRFEAAVDWRTQKNEIGIGWTIELTDDSGLFYFFDPDNVELIAKVLDACDSPFDSFWVFTAGLTDVEYQMEVFDSLTGRRRYYTNPLETPAAPVQDTSAFKPCGGSASSGVAATDTASWALPSWARDALRAGNSDRPRSAEPRAGNCTPGPTRLCLGGGRFQVDVEWMTNNSDSGPGRTIELTDDTGAFWFFNDANVEVLIKVLDACASAFDSFWVFAAGLTNVEVRLTVTDTETGMVKVYENPLDRPFQPIQDTSAFKTCS